MDDGGAYLIVHVDDIIIAAAPESPVLARILQKLEGEFTINDLGEPKMFLGLQIIRDREQRKMVLNQERFIEDIVHRFGGDSVRPYPTPGDDQVRLSGDMCPTTPEEKAKMDKIPYRELVGCLNYLVVWTRYDIAAQVQILSRYVSNPGIAHWRAALRVLSYLRGTKEKGLVFRPGGEGIALTGASDSDHAGCPDTRRSTSGGGVFLNGLLVWWQSKRQPTVALSSAEAEWCAAVEVSRQLLWIKNMLSEIGAEVHGSISILEDNAACVHISKNNHHGKLRHIQIKLLYLKEHVENNIVRFKQIPGEENPADIWTKIVKPGAYKKLMNIIDSCCVN
jgi:hypothetical protein